MTDALWALAGVVVGSVLTGVMGWLKQSRQFLHDREMLALQNKSAEMVKTILIEMLNHRRYVDRSFNALKRSVGGYADDQIRQFLHEVGARRASRAEGTEEWWYLASRTDERLARKKVKESEALPLFADEPLQDESVNTIDPRNHPDTTP